MLKRHGKIFISIEKHIDQNIIRNIEWSASTKRMEANGSGECEAWTESVPSLVYTCIEKFFLTRLYSIQRANVMQMKIFFILCMYQNSSSSSKPSKHRRRERLRPFSVFLAIVDCFSHFTSVFLLLLCLSSISSFCIMQFLRLLHAHNVILALSLLLVLLLLLILKK